MIMGPSMHLWSPIFLSPACLTQTHFYFIVIRFAQVSSEATRKEAELQRLVRAWDEFETKKRAVEEWASRAEALLADSRVDSKQAVDFHKRFFQGADERAVSELVRSGRELIEVRKI